MAPQRSERDGPAVLYELCDRGRIAVVTLNRPRQLNAYNTAMRDGLFAALSAVRDDPQVRAMILRGAGRAFSTGGDVREFGSAPSATRAREVRWLRDVWGTLQRLPAITIAAVHGYAVGGGFEMALLCDQCVAAVDARFALPETGLAMIPGVGGTQTLPRLIGAPRTHRMVLTSEWLDAREAQHLGLVSKVVPLARLFASALTLARRVARLDAAIVTGLKRCVREGLDLVLDDGLALERRLARTLEPAVP